MPDKLLINTGMSPAGWSSFSAFLRCERLFYYTSGRRAAEATQQATLAPDFALLRGSLGHVGLAHHYARQGMAQAGLDPEIYYEPIEAMKLVAAGYPPKLGSGEKTSDVLDIAIEMVVSYRAHYEGERLQVVAVEAPVSFLLPPGPDGVVREVTQRLDLVIRDDAGKVHLCDHKLSAELSKKSLMARYSLSTQFLLMQLVGQRLHGRDFGGCLVNIVGAHTDRTPQQRFYRFPPEAAPAALRELPDVIAGTLATIAHRRASGGGGPAAWRPAFHEEVCFGSYGGRCVYYERCKWGNL